MPAVFVVRAIALGLALLGFGIAYKSRSTKEPEKEAAPKKSPLPKKEKLDKKPEEKKPETPPVIEAEETPEETPEEKAE